MIRDGVQTVQPVRLGSLRSKDSMVVQVAWRDVMLIVSGRVDDVASTNMIENWITKPKARLVPVRMRAKGRECCKRGTSVTSARL